MPICKPISMPSRSFWLYAAISAIFAVAALFLYLNSARASPGFRTDQFVRMIESRITGSTHLSIGPGVVLVVPQCQCSVKYLGTKIQGHVYAVYIEKLD